MQAVRIALEETISLIANGKRANEVVLEYLTGVAIFQLHAKQTLLAIKVIEEPSEWKAKVRSPPPPCLFVCFLPVFLYTFK